MCSTQQQWHRRRRFHLPSPSILSYISSPPPPPPPSPLLSTFGTLPIPDQVDDWTGAPRCWHCWDSSGKGKGMPRFKPGLRKFTVSCRHYQSSHRSSKFIREQYHFSTPLQTLKETFGSGGITEVGRGALKGKKAHGSNGENDWN